MKDNFDKNLKELNPEDKTGNISLDEIIQEYYRDSNFVSWRWNTAYTKFLDKSIILDKLPTIYLFLFLLKSYAQDCEIFV